MSNPPPPLSVVAAQAVKLERREDGIARITLARPERHNAFDDALIAALDDILADLADDDDVRVVTLTGEGKSFSAGADIGWMKRMAGYSEAQNRADALVLVNLMHRLASLAKPTVALVNGPAIGGGVGLVAACDIAIAADNAVFALSEVRLGIIPAVIMPYVIDAMGARATRRFALTGERFGAAEAGRLGLVHEVVPAMYLDTAADRVISDLLGGGPAAQATIKAFMHEIAHTPGTEATRARSAELIAAVRASDEGREGLSAFLDKRTAGFVRARKPG